MAKLLLDELEVIKLLEELELLDADAEKIVGYGQEYEAVDGV